MCEKFCFIFIWLHSGRGDYRKLVSAISMDFFVKSVHYSDLIRNSELISDFFLTSI